MHLITRNVNTAFEELVRTIHEGSLPIEEAQSRIGKVLYVLDPVMVTYSQPQERVLLNVARDANPFFHLYESLYLLAGRDDVAPLSSYCTKIGRMASDDGKSFNGSYGVRWRKYPGCSTVDQLELLVGHLQRNPRSRRAVLQMWSVDKDLLKVDNTLDTCCNLSAVFSIRENKLGITVYNRSNDLILGMLGANAVQFSILQEYLAAHLGLEMGSYTQTTANLHVYIDSWQPAKWLEEYKVLDDDRAWLRYYDWKPFPLVKDPTTFDAELPEFVERFSKNPYGAMGWKEPFLEHVAQPMLLAYWGYKMNSASTSMWVERISSGDWRTVARNWINRRLQKRNSNVSK